MMYRSLYLLIIILLAGCGQKPPIIDTSRQTIDWSQETAESVKTRIMATARKTEFLTAFFSLSMNPPPDKMMSSLSGVITIDSRTSPAKVRIKAFHLFGSTLFDMVNTDQVSIYVPRKKTMYIGIKGQQEKGGTGPQTIFANMMIDPENLIIEKTKLEITTDGIILHLQDGWLKLNPQNGLITSRRKDGMDIFYSDYTVLSNKTLLPTVIKIATIDGVFKADCQLSQISLPPSLPPHFFDLDEYKPLEIKKLEELH